MQGVKVSDAPFNGVKIFSATVMADRLVLGEKVSMWLEQQRKRPGFELREITVTQSSDEAFHCLAIEVWYWEPLAKW